MIVEQLEFAESKKADDGENMGAGGGFIDIPAGADDNLPFN